MSAPFAVKTLSENILARVRASSWTDLVDCPLRWYFKQVEGLRNPKGPPVAIGLGVHKGTELFDRAMLAGQEPSVDAAANLAYETVMAPQEENGDPCEINWNDDEERIKQSAAIDYAVQHTINYCRQFAPRMHYTDIELRCVALDIETKHGTIRTSGTIDRVRIMPSGLPGIVDFKTGGKAATGEEPGPYVADTKGHHLQTGIYTLMGEQETKKPMGESSIVGFQTNSKLRIGVSYIENPKRALVGNAEFPGVIEIAAHTLKSGVFPPNPKSMLCNKKYCPGWNRCPYHE